MPIYDFTCPPRGDFEAAHRMSERDDALPSCGLAAMCVVSGVPS
jgi:hypothetical protein